VSSIEVTGAAPMTGISFTWQSSAPALATVSNAGVLHGVAAGAVTVTARADGKSGMLRTRVRRAP
jgi:uncharacterized protein YjdB